MASAASGSAGDSKAPSRSNSQSSLADSQSTGGTPQKARTPKEVSVLIKCLLGKDSEVDGTNMQEKVLIKNMKKISEIAKGLIEDASLIDLCEVAVRDGGLKQTVAATAKDSAFDDNPEFNEAIKTINDLPVPFLRGVLQRHSATKIEKVVIEHICKKSTKLFKNTWSYLTGRGKPTVQHPKCFIQQVWDP